MEITNDAEQIDENINLCKIALEKINTEHNIKTELLAIIMLIVKNQQCLADLHQDELEDQRSMV